MRESSEIYDAARPFPTLPFVVPHCSAGVFVSRKVRRQTKRVFEPQGRTLADLWSDRVSGVAGKRRATATPLPTLLELEVANANATHQRAHVHQLAKLSNLSQVLNDPGLIAGTLSPAGRDLHGPKQSTTPFGNLQQDLDDR